MLKNRRYFVLVGMLLAAVCGLLGLAACGEEHVHDWGEWETVTAATCTAEGSEQRACKECEEKETRAIQKTAHTEVEVGAVEATCLEAGHQAGTECSVCHAPLSGLETIPALGHEEQAPQHVEENGTHYHTVSCSRCGQQVSKEECDFDFVSTPATCTAAEHREYTCTECDYTYESDEGEALGHSYGDVEHVKVPTCTEKGLDRETCTREGCGDVKETVLEMAQHTVVAYGENKDATCTEAGEKAGEWCSVCHHVIKDKETIPALGHSWPDEWTTVTAATCTDDGQERQECTVCRTVQTRTVQKKGHTSVDVGKEEATCLVAGHQAGTKCSECGVTLSGLETIPALGHAEQAPQHVEENGTHYHTVSCSRCGQQVSKEECDFDFVSTPATCTAAEHREYTCKECDYTYERDEGEALGHTWPVEWTTVTDATCTDDGQEKQECTVCHTVQTRTVQKKGHTSADVEKLEATCLAAGHEAGTECSVCGEVLSGLETIPALGHSYGEVEHVKLPTCTDQGLDRQTCTRDGCGDIKDTVLDMTRHTVVTYGENKDATCTEAGEKAGEWCSVCHHVVKERETIPALGHEMQSPEHYVKEGADWHKGSCARCGVIDVDEPCIFDVVKTAATCTKAEHHVHTCPTCHHEYEHDEGQPLGHAFGDWHFDVKTYDMSLRDRDGAETVIRQHIRTCSNPGHEADPEYPEVEACTEEQVDRVAATCTMSGYTNYKCTTCENTYTGDRVNALGHQWEKNEDGTTKYTTMYYEAAKMFVHYKTCTRDGCPQPTGTYYACRYDKVTWEAANCEHGKTMVYTCLDCKQVNRIEQGEPLGHSYGAWIHDDTTSGETSMHYHVCGRNGCGHREEAACVMQSADRVATCQKPGQDIDICKDCRYTVTGEEIAKLDHDLADQPYVADHANHRHYQECKRCNEKVYEDCPYSESVTAATCTTDEETTFTCPTCQDSYTVVTKNSAGHRVSQYTESNKFYHTGNCDECGELVSVAHDFSESNICKVCRTDGLSYTFETGSNGTQARVSRGIKDNAYYYINTPKLIIPATVNIDGKGDVPVVGISTDAFFGNRYITEVELPLSLTYIGYRAFYGCTNLAEVYFTGHEAGEQNVSDCKLNRIEDGAFYGCTSLTNAILPNTLQYIGAQAFRGCKQLSDIEIPELVTEIEDHAFMDTAYFLASENWGTDGVLYIGKHLIRARESLSGTYTVNAGVVSISAEAFMDCKYLTEIELPATLKAIDRDAFKGCDTLQSVKFDGTFAEYLGIRFDNNEASPMHVATALTFAGEDGDLTIPEGAAVIPAGAFRGSQIKSIVIPASVTSIGAGAFAGCTELESITFEKGSNLLSIGADVVTGSKFYDTPANWQNGVLYLKDEEGTPVALVAAKEAELAAYEKYDGENFDGSAKQVVIAEGTRVVAPEAFEGFTQLRYVVVAGTVVYLGEHVFEGCTGLDRVNFRGEGKSWFCYSPQLGRVYTDASVYGGAANDDYATQRKAASMFKAPLYTLQWKRTGV